MWDDILNKEFVKPYYEELIKTINKEYKTKTIYPKYEDIFNAFKLTDYNNLKVIIIGQDPYHGKNQAHGLAFSTLDSKTPKSLINIKKELENDLGFKTTNNNNLSKWAKQGVLLLNTILTVKEGAPLSHANIGWETFTLNIFKAITNINRPLVFILWGKKAEEYEKYINNNKHLVIKSSHPSPFSARISFFGSKPFSKTNKFLAKNNIEIIDFKI